MKKLSKKEKEIRALLYPKKDDNVHYLWHKFLNKFQDKAGRWKLIGYPLMMRVEEWIKKYPHDIQLVQCDDSVHASSSLILFEHKCKNDYMGTTVVYIPQCTGEQPIEFFLYPDNVTSLIKALQVVENNYKKNKRL